MELIKPRIQRALWLALYCNRGLMMREKDKQNTEALNGGNKGFNKCTSNGKDWYRTIAVDSSLWVM